MICKTFLPAIAVVIIRVSTIEQIIAFKAVQRLHQVSAATKFGVKFYLFFYRLLGIGGGGGGGVLSFFLHT